MVAIDGVGQNREAQDGLGPPKALADQVRQPVARIQPLDQKISETIRLAQFFAIHPVNSHEITILPDLSDE